MGIEKAPISDTTIEPQDSSVEYPCVYEAFETPEGKGPNTPHIYDEAAFGFFCRQQSCISYFNPDNQRRYEKCSKHNIMSSTKEGIRQSQLTPQEVFVNPDESSPELVLPDSGLAVTVLNSGITIPRLTIADTLPYNVPNTIYERIAEDMMQRIGKISLIFLDKHRYLRDKK